MLVFRWQLSQIGGVGALSGSASTLRRILTQINNAGGEIWVDDEQVTIEEVETHLGSAWESSATGKLLIVGDETSNDPAQSQGVLIQYVDD